MNKTQLIKLISQETGVLRCEVSLVLEQFFLDVRRVTKNGESVNLRNFGKFAALKRSARQYPNFRNGEIISIPETRRFCFKASLKIRDM
jgi:nucleoid DNA-binding protein